MKTLTSSRQTGLEFLRVPDHYYEMLPQRLGESASRCDSLREAQIMLDRDEWGELLQTFSKPITTGSALFVELVQRNGARGFGSGNIRVLFEAVECERAARGGW